MLDVIRRCPDLDFLLLTKRPENFVPRLSQILNLMGHHLTLEESFLRVFVENMVRGWGEVQYSAPEVGRQNYWLGVSVENQEAADRRIPELLRIPAKVRFLSCEPLLSSVNFSIVPGFNKCGSAGQDLLRNFWCIAGCESGPHRRNQADYHDHARYIIEQCRSAGVPVFHKQMPVFVTPWGRHGRVSHDPAEWPADLRVQQFPHVPR
jgi:protein gp37